MAISGEKELSRPESNEAADEVYAAEGEVPDSAVYRALEQARDPGLQAEDVPGILHTMALDGTVEVNGTRMPFSEAAQYQAGHASELAVALETPDGTAEVPSVSMSMEQGAATPLEQGEEAITGLDQENNLSARYARPDGPPEAVPQPIEPQEAIESANLGAFFEDLRAAQAAGNPDAAAALRSLEAGSMPQGAYEEAFAQHLIHAIDSFDTAVRGAKNETDIIMALNALYQGVPRLPVVAPSGAWMDRNEAEQAILGYMTNRTDRFGLAGPLKERIESLWQEWDGVETSASTEAEPTAPLRNDVEQAETLAVPEVALQDEDPGIGVEPASLPDTVPSTIEDQAAEATQPQPEEEEVVPGAVVPNEAALEQGEDRFTAFERAVDHAASIEDVIRALNAVADPEGRYASPRTLGTNVHVPTMAGYVRDAEHWPSVRQHVQDYCVRDTVDQLYGFRGDDATRTIARELRGDVSHEQDRSIVFEPATSAKREPEQTTPETDVSPTLESRADVPRLTYPEQIASWQHERRTLLAAAQTIDDLVNIVKVNPTIEREPGTAGYYRVLQNGSPGMRISVGNMIDDLNELNRAGRDVGVETRYGKSTLRTDIERNDPELAAALARILAAQRSAA